MKTEIPASYQPGVQRIEQMNDAVTREWLRDEIFDEVHMLAGRTEDFPVQAIVNHHAYLSLQARERIAGAIGALVRDWHREANWPDEPACALLDLAGELSVDVAKPKLLAACRDRTFRRALTKPVFGALFGAIALLASNDDRAFWRGLPSNEPTLAGMAFQVLARIAPEDALELLPALPAHDGVLASVARKLPDFLSRSPEPVQSARLATVIHALKALPSARSEPLRAALRAAGYEVPEAREETSAGSIWVFSRLEGFMKTLGRPIQPRGVGIGDVQPHASAKCAARQLEAA